MSAGQLPPTAKRRCAILPFSVAKETGVRLHPAHTPCRWHEHQFSSEWWMDRRMRQPAERAPDVASADLVYLTDHSFSLWCHRQRAVAKDQLSSAAPAQRLKARACLEAAAPVGGVAQAVGSLPRLDANGSWAQPLVPERLVPCRPQLKEELWRRLMAHPTIALAMRRGVPVVLTLTNNECGAPWRQAYIRGVALLHTSCTCHAHATHTPCTRHAHTMCIPCTHHAHTMHTHHTMHLPRTRRSRRAGFCCR